MYSNPQKLSSGEVLELRREAVAMKDEAELRFAELKRRETMLKVKTDFYDEAHRKQDELNRILHELELQENFKGLSQ